MKVISLYQPYATLVILGAKRFETRGWSTNYRGPLAIHATKAMPGWCKNLLPEWPFADYLNGLALPQGAIIGTVDVVNCQTSESWLANARSFEDGAAERWAEEYNFGDYSAGRFAWELKNPIQFTNPIPAKGSQGFWSYDLNIIPMNHEALHLPR